MNLRRFDLDGHKPVPIIHERGQFVLYDDVVRMIVAGKIRNKNTRLFFLSVPRDRYASVDELRATGGFDAHFRFHNHVTYVNTLLKPFDLYIFHRVNIGYRIIEKGANEKPPHAIRDADLKLMSEILETNSCKIRNSRLHRIERLIALGLIIKLTLATYELTETGRQVLERKAHYVQG